MFAELILPVPLNRTFTYYLPDSMGERAAVGMRVVAPFGKNHHYTGIIVGLLPVLPPQMEGVELKTVENILDEYPVLHKSQYTLWQWIADYYMCPIGDVMKAALPSELKPEIGKQGVIRLDFKPKMVPFVRIVLQDELSGAFNLLHRSPKQQALYMALLDRSKAMQQSEPVDIRQDELLRVSGCSSDALHELCKKGLCQIFLREVSRLDVAENITEVLEPMHDLTEMQRVAYRSICQQWRDHQVTLLHGVTSSGKTEIYIHLISEVIAKGRQVLLMVPEIALTTQLCQRLRRVFGKRMMVYHSKLSDTERVEIWKKMIGSQENGPDLILGVRSSVFLPFRQLGLVIVDEEHEPSYKQQDPSPRYHGRDVAVVLANRHGAKVLLGSATPSLESWYLASQGKYGMVRLSERHAGVSLPRITLVSLLEARKDKAMVGPFSPTLIKALARTLQEGHQAILFQNRRGFAHQVECTQCGWTPRCPRCDVSLTYHKRTRQLSCHICGHQTPWPAKCPTCGNDHLEFSGFGTERIEEQLQQLLPLAKPVRMDTDTTGSRKSYERLINDFENHNANVLIGTQMVSKGLDFSAVDTVGVLSADSLMNFPDFRAQERAFQLMEQVAGRAGRRAGQEGEVLIQCGNPKHSLLQQVLSHNYQEMAETQLADRKKYNYPPFTRLIMINLRGRYEDRTRKLALQYANLMRQSFGARVLGPEAPGISRVKNFYIQQILLKVEREASVVEVRRCLNEIHKIAMVDSEMQKIMFYYDVDPM